MGAKHFVLALLALTLAAVSASASEAQKDPEPEVVFDDLVEILAKQTAIALFQIPDGTSVRVFQKKDQGPAYGLAKVTTDANGDPLWKIYVFPKTFYRVFKDAWGLQISEDGVVYVDGERAKGGLIYTLVHELFHLSCYQGPDMLGNERDWKCEEFGVDYNASIAACYLVENSDDDELKAGLCDKIARAAMKYGSGPLRDAALACCNDPGQDHVPDVDDENCGGVAPECPDPDQPGSEDDWTPMPPCPFCD